MAGCGVCGGAACAGGVCGSVCVSACVRRAIYNVSSAMDQEDVARREKELRRLVGASHARPRAGGCTTVTLRLSPPPTARSSNLGTFLVALRSCPGTFPFQEEHSHSIPHVVPRTAGPRERPRERAERSGACDRGVKASRHRRRLCRRVNGIVHAFGWCARARTVCAGACLSARAVLARARARALAEAESKE